MDKKKKASRKKKTAAEKEAERQVRRRDSKILLTVFISGCRNQRTGGQRSFPSEPEIGSDRFAYYKRGFVERSNLNPSNQHFHDFQPINGPVDEVQREKQLLCRTQRLLAAQRIALQTRQAEMLQSQTKFYDVC